MVWVLALSIAYLLGTFPSAVLIARANGVDITTFGSGNPGASNVTRALGWRKGVWVFALDAAKGAIAAGAGLWLAGSWLAGSWGAESWLAGSWLAGSWLEGRAAGYLLGAAAVLGHVAPATRRFRGGKGVATGGGVILVMLPVVGVGVIVLWWVVTRLTGTASIGSIVAVVAAGIGMAARGAPAWEFAAAIGLCLLILARHLENVRRIVQRREHTVAAAGWMTESVAGENRP
ncbi:MAG: glycerol-3-phosphate acyltransferase [Ilumatobacteraceae bacterium]